MATKDKSVAEVAAETPAPEAAVETNGFILEDNTAAEVAEEAPPVEEVVELMDGFTQVNYL